MEDLLGEDWQRPASRPSTSLNPSTFASNYSSLRSTPQPPVSGLSTPPIVSRPGSTVNGSTKPAGDSFGNLLAPKSQTANGGNVTMQERQRQLMQEKRRQQDQQSALWDDLGNRGSGTSTPADIGRPSPALRDDEDDILAAFNKDAPVDSASYFAPPPLSGGVSGRSTPAAGFQQQIQVPIVNGFDDDDDPFELGKINKKSNGHVKSAGQITSNDDDILGDLGKPVAERSKRTASPDEVSTVVTKPEDDNAAASQDGPLAELVDMGFPADTAKIALAETGGDVQNAVGWLLQQAHEESKQKARGKPSTSRTRSPQTTSRSPQRRPREQEAMPAWMRSQDNSRPTSAVRRQDNASPVNGGEKDAARTAQELGNKIFKSGLSMWKASQKQMAKTVAEFQQDAQTDPNQPKWMRSAGAEPQRRQPEQRTAPARSQVVADRLTDEANALDAPRERPQQPARRAQPVPESVQQTSRGRSPIEPLAHRPSPQPKFMQQTPSQSDRRPAAKLSRQAVEDQAEQAYVSPARRKRPPPQPQPEMKAEPEVDLFSPPAPTISKAPPTSSRAPPATSKPSPAPSKPKAPPRSIPSVSPAALSASATHRTKGGEHFKRGDYAAAHESYTAALTPLPPTHPVTIIVLTNRALTALKTGDAKVAVSDADKALEIIGPSLGAGETIDLGPGEGTKDMKEFYGKALMRKAEALEHLEKYADAAAVWQQAVAAGVGGAVSLKARDRCEKAAAPKPSASSKPAAVKSFAPGPGKLPPAKSLGNSLQRPTLPSVASGEAVKKLRAANEEAEKADDEKFALSDSVEAKLNAWKGGKADNLRALLQSMDVVLWPEAGWKKVGMGDLVVPGKVKVVYMRAIGKVHPDKIPQNATTEQRMISAAVFATLNEAWDKFRKDNNL